MPSQRAYHAVLCALLTSALSGCYVMRPSSGGGQTDFVPPREVRAADVAVPDGYRVEVVATGLTFPTGVTFDDAGGVYVVESGYSYGEVWTTPQLLRIDADGSTQRIAAGGRNGPWTGVTYGNGEFYVAEGGELEGGRILAIRPDGSQRVLVADLPSRGDHHTNGPVLGRDGMLYFGQGTATNSAVVGPDNAKFGWLKRYPTFHDIPCRDIRLNGQNFDSQDALGERGTVSTGAFLPYATPSQPGQVIRGALPCSGAILRLPTTGGPLELVAWGLRNPFGLAVAPDGTLYVTENGYDDRGSRPVWGAGDVLWRIEPGRWYGWPDFSAGQPLTKEDFNPPGKPAPKPLLAEPPDTPPRPVAVLGVHASANGLDISRSPRFGHVGEAFIALFGDQAPDTGKVLHPVGFRVVRVNPANGLIEDFMLNRSQQRGPASRINSGGIERPVAARFDPSGETLYVVDFGVMLMDKQGPKPQPSTGVLWRIRREATP